MKVVFYSLKEYEKPFLQKSLPDFIRLVPEEAPLSLSNVSATEGATAISVFTNDDLSEPVLKELVKRGVRYIAIRAAGYDHINLNLAAELGLQVANVPNYSPYAIAEHTVALLQVLNRKLHLTLQHNGQYNFSLNGLTGFDLNGKTIGIVGTGKIGAIAAKILNGYGCKLLGFDLEKDVQLEKQFGMRYVSLSELAQQADAITIHLPMNAQTSGIFNMELFNQMKKHVLIVNTGRGGLLKTAEALEALRQEKIGGLALDVYEKEKGVFFFDRSQNRPNDPILDQLLQHPNVVLTPHQAFLTQEALGNIADATMDSLIRWSKGEQSATQLKG